MHYSSLKRHPYIVAMLSAILLAIVVWLCIPKEYTAITKLSDEYKEMDLSIGLNSMDSKLKENLGDESVGMDDVEVYCKILTTEDFARIISEKRVPGTQLTYGEYLGDKDTLEAVQKHIDYNVSIKQSTLTVGFSDRNPLVATQMLDSVTTELQHAITRHRHQVIDAAYGNAVKELNVAKENYRKAEKKYTDYSDANYEAKSKAVFQEEDALMNEVKLAKEQYEKALTQYVRQKYLRVRANASFAIIKSNSVPQQPNSHFVSYLLSFVCIALILTHAFLLYHRKKKHWSQILTDKGDFFSPWCLTITIWIGDIALYFLQGTLDPIGPQFITSFSLWLATFLPASIIAYWLCRDDSTPIYTDHKKPIDISLYAFYGLMALSMLMTLLYAKTIYNIVNQFDGQNMLFNIRVLTLNNTESFGLLAHTQGLNLALFLVAIWLYPRISGWTVALIVVINLILEIAMMEKSGVLIMILGALFVLYERGKIRVRTIGLTMLGIIGLFFLFNLSKEDSNAKESLTFMDFFGTYVTSPIVAFERLRITLTDVFAPNTLNDFYPQLLRFCIKVDTIERLQDFVFVPIVTNVYTIMQPFYNDFGHVGVAFFGFLYGSVFGFVYCRFREGSELFKCFYTYLVEVIIIQFYNENLLQVFHLVLETALVIILLKVLTRFNFIPVPSKSLQHEPIQE